MPRAKKSAIGGDAPAKAKPSHSPATEADAVGGRLTPAMKQYFAVREKHPDALLLFQMGDFYETFFEDAKSLSQVLNVTLTSRGTTDSGAPIPLSGFPVKSLDAHLPKLVAAGLRVVICEQVEDASQAKGVVERDVTRVLSAGTVVEDALLDPTRENFLAALVITPKRCGLAWLEMSTGRFQATQLSDSELEGILTRIGPAELLVTDQPDAPSLLRAQSLSKRLGCVLTRAADWTFSPSHAVKALKGHFGVATLEGFGFRDDSGPELTAAGALLIQLKEQQRAELAHITKLEPFHSGDTVPLDPATIAALELVETLRGKSRKHTLLWALDCCMTSMGSRLLRDWLLNPLTGAARVQLRHAAVEELMVNPRRRELVRQALEGLGDLERLAGRLGTGRASPRDLMALANSLGRLPLLAGALSGCESSLLSELEKRLDPASELRELIERAIGDEPSNTPKDGPIIRDGFDQRLDELRELSRDGRRAIARFQEQSAEKSGIPSVKVGYNSVFGYYLEVTNAHKDRVPAEWIRRQTLTGRERYITPELKEFEARVLNAQEEAVKLEAELLVQVRTEASRHAGRVVASARIAAMADVLAAFAHRAADRGYTRPELTSGRELQLTAGRHPVLDLTLEPGRLVPNDCELEERRTMALITGPNMAGKSTYIRMVALLTLMAQCGSFVPAEHMRLGMVDRVFSRLGSADEIQHGASTFMVEMVETAGILNAATQRSLVILDEVGRGTSTYDGVSIAWALSEYLAGEAGSRTLFATHYHELTQLSQRLPSVVNLNVSVREWGEDIIFLHKIVEGAADRSYGIHVARLAGLPAAVVERAKGILAKLEAESAGLAAAQSAAPLAQSDGPKIKRPKQVQLMLFTPTESRVLRALAAVDPDKLPPEVLKAEVSRLQALAMDELG